MFQRGERGWLRFGEGRRRRRGYVQRILQFGQGQVYLCLMATKDELLQVSLIHLISNSIYFSPQQTQIILLKITWCTSYNIFQSQVSMQSKIICINPKCRSQLKRPPVPYIKCPSCKTQFFVFCHEFPNKTFSYVDCKKCNKQLYYFFCFKCSAVLSYSKYRMGSISQCKCGFVGCYVVCNNCNKAECFPPERRYEGVSWKCTHCKSPFNFMTCDQCFHPIYANKFREGDSMSCKNPRCKTALKVRKCQNCNFIFMTHNNNNMCQPCFKGNYKKPSQTQYKIQPQKQPQKMYSSMTNGNGQEGPGALCKVCLDKPAQYLNLKCFHMSCCGVCVGSMKNVCPICRANGEFKKVFI